MTGPPRCFTCRRARRYIRARLYMPSGLFLEPSCRSPSVPRGSTRTSTASASSPTRSARRRSRRTTNAGRRPSRSTASCGARRARSACCACRSPRSTAAAAARSRTRRSCSRSRPGPATTRGATPCTAASSPTTSARCGTEDQKKRWLPKLASGELVGAIAMTEPGTGSDLQNVKTKAIRGRRRTTSSTAPRRSSPTAPRPTLIIVVAKTDPGEAAKGVSLLAAGDRGRGRASAAAACSTRSACTARTPSELFFDDVRVPGREPARRRGGPGLRPAHAAAAAGAADHRRVRGRRAWRPRSSMTIALHQGPHGVRPARSSSSRTRKFKLAEAATEVAVSQGVPRPVHRAAPARASWTSPARRWSSGGRPSGCPGSPTSACSCSAATAT